MHLLKGSIPGNPFPDGTPLDVDTPLEVDTPLKEKKPLDVDVDGPPEDVLELEFAPGSIE